MKQLRFLFTVLFSAVLTVFLTVACAPSDDAPTADTGAADAGAEAETLIMATSADYPPYEYIPSGSTEIVGFDIDIANYITDELGYGLEIQNIDFNGLLPALQSERVDFVMAGMTPTEERQENADFSRVYYDAKNTIVSNAGSGLTTVESLSGRRVGAQLGSIQEEAAREIEGAEIVALNRIGEMIQELKVGRVDALIIEDTVAKGYVEANPELEFTTIESEGASGSAIAFPKGSPLLEEFDAVLEQMMSDGTMDELVTKWFGEDSPAQAETPAE